MRASVWATSCTRISLYMEYGTWMSSKYLFFVQIRGSG